MASDTLLLRCSSADPDHNPVTIHQVSLRAGIWIALLCSVLFPCAAWADVSSLVVLWQQSSEDSELAVRMSGQLADLPVRIQSVGVETEKASSSTERLLHATQLRSQMSALCLVYWDKEPRGRRLRIVTTDRLFERQIEQTERAQGLSVAMESAAVVTRAVVRALLAGEPTGVSLAEAMAAQPVPSVTREQQASISSEPPERALLFLGIGWQGGADGQSPLGHHAVGLSASIPVQRFVLRLSLWTGLPSRWSDDLFSVSLSRYAASLGAQVVLLQTETLRLLTGLGVTGSLFHRSTLSATSGYEPTAQQAVFGIGIVPSVALWIRPSLRIPLWLELSVSAEALLRRPRLGYAETSGFVVYKDLWPVWPLGGLQILWSPLTRSQRMTPPSSEGAPASS